MKILHVITSLASGGAQSMLYELLRSWKNEQDQHTVISLVSGGSTARQPAPPEVPVYEIGMRAGRLSPGGLSRLFFAIQGAQPDLVQSWLYHADLIGGLTARLACRAPIVWGIHHTYSVVSSLKPSTVLIARMNALLSGVVPTRIICCSKTALETHAVLGYQRRKMVVIGNGVETTRLRPDPSARGRLRRELQVPAGTRLIGMFARFHPQKDVPTFLSAAGLLHQDVQNVHFLLAGNGLDDGNLELRQWVDAAGIRGSVHLLGFRSDVFSLYPALDVFTLSSSDGEAAPLAICEAMASGVPCVATDVGDVRQMVANAGECVPAREPRALAQAWKAILDLPAADYARLSRSARRKAENEYNIDDVCRNYHELYQQITR